MIAVRNDAVEIIKLLFTDYRDQTISIIDNVDVRVYYN